VSKCDVSCHRSREDREEKCSDTLITIPDGICTKDQDYFRNTNQGQHGGGGRKEVLEKAPSARATPATENHVFKLYMIMQACIDGVGMNSWDNVTIIPSRNAVYRHNQKTTDVAFHFLLQTSLISAGKVKR